VKGECERTGSLPIAANILARLSRKSTNISLGRNKGKILLGHLRGGEEGKKKDRRKKREERKKRSPYCFHESRPC